jgi:hypothetical protein
MVSSKTTDITAITDLAVSNGSDFFEYYIKFKYEGDNMKTYENDLERTEDELYGEGLTDEEKIIFLIVKRIEYEEWRKNLKLINSKLSEEKCFKSKIDLINQRTEIHNRLTALISLTVKFLTPQTVCKLLGTNMIEYHKINFNLKLPNIRFGEHLEEDLREYENMQAKCLKFSDSLFKRNRSVQ